MRDLDQTLRSINPVRSGAPGTQDQLEDILSTPRTKMPVRRPRWTLAVAAATVTAVAVTYVVIDPFGTTAQPAYAVTPLPLPSPGGDRPAADVLDEISQRVENLPDTRPARWDTEHFVADSWSLATRVDGVQVTSAIIPERRETWCRPNGKCDWKARTLPPEFQNDEQRKVWEKAGAVGRAPQERSSDGLAEDEPDMKDLTVHERHTEPPTTVTGMRKWLAPGYNPRTIPAAVLLDSIGDKSHVYSPAQRATLLRTLKSVKGITYEGMVKDRAGRAGEAFSATVGLTGDDLPMKQTLVFDKATGTLLAAEEQILDDPGKLNVKPYSVLQYTTFLKSERLT